MKTMKIFTIRKQENGWIRPTHEYYSTKSEAEKALREPRFLIWGGALERAWVEELDSEESDISDPIGW